MSNFKEDVSEEEIMFEASVMDQDKEQYENSVKTNHQNNRPSSYQLAATHGDAQGVWTLTENPTSTPLLAVSTYVGVETAKTKDSTVIEILELSSPDVSFTCSSLSDELVERDVCQSPSLTTVSVKPSASALEIVSDSPLSTEVSTSSYEVSLGRQSYMSLLQSSSTPTASSTPTEVTIPLTAPSTPVQPSSHGLHTSPVLSFSSKPVTPKESSSVNVLVPSTSGELTRSGSMKTDNSGSSTQSCKVPVAPRDEVVITIEDVDEDERMYKGMKSVHDAPCEYKRGVTQSMEKVDIAVLDRANGNDDMSRSVEKPIISMTSICEDFAKTSVEKSVNDVSDVASGYEIDNVKFVDDDVMDYHISVVPSNGMNEGSNVVQNPVMDMGKVRITEKNADSNERIGGGQEPIPCLSGENVVVRNADMDEEEDTWSLEDNETASKESKLSVVVDNSKFSLMNLNGESKQVK